MKTCINHPNWQQAQINRNNTIEKKKQQRIEEYNISPKLCKYCNKPLSYDLRFNAFCCSSHAVKYNNKHRKIDSSKKKTVFCKKCNNPFVVKVNSCNLLLCSQCKEEEKNILKNINLQNKLNLQETVKLQTEYINCSVCGEKFIKLKTSNRKTCSKECRCKIFSETAKRTKLGGNHNRFSLWYESKIAGKVFLESSYELKVAQELDRNNINWIRPKSFSYVTEDNKNHLYYPDFYLIDYKVYLDPKNSYLIEKDKIKISTVSQQNNIKVLVLTKEQLTWRTIKCLI